MLDTVRIILTPYVPGLTRGNPVMIGQQVLFAASCYSYSQVGE